MALTRGQKVAKGFKIAGWSIFIPAILTMLFFTVVNAFFPDHATDILGFRTMLVGRTESMEPTLSHNDLVVIQKVDFHSLELGDIVTFKTMASTKDGAQIELTITHSIIEVVDDPDTGERYYRTKGDNPNVGRDAPLSIDGKGNTNAYLGKVVFTDRFLGNTLAFFSSIPGMIMVVVDIVGIVVLANLLSRKGKGIKENKEVALEANAPITIEQNDEGGNENA